MREVLNIAKALSDQNRLRALMMLEKQQLCVCQIIELLALAPSTVSKHMSILRQVRLVEGQKNGRWMHYRLAGTDAPKYVRDIVKQTLDALGDDPKITQDRKRLGKILKMDKGKLCRKQRKN
jgi:DNA-binding transcriptional ArsR family regulator